MADMRAPRFLHLLRASMAAALMFALTLAHAREISAQEAVSQVQHDTSGKVLSVQTLDMGKRKVYRIKVLTRDGQVRVVEVPADQ
jgi:uncharacterized membrane protein YkoI